MTARIHALSPEIAEKVAAQEVVERPASVLKELIENAIDAGATQIVVRLEAGGKTLCEVEDNGLGIHPEDLESAILRHTTSKIKTLRDLEYIDSLGFRGEALFSLAAVSQLNITSRRAGFEAYSIESPTFKRQNENEILFLNSKTGTKVSAAHLFLSVPARQKFLRSPGAELAAAREVVERIALLNPDIAFRFMNNGETLFWLERETMPERVKAFLFAGNPGELVIEETPLPHGGNVKIYWARGLFLASAKRIIQSVNHRYLKDRLLAQAVNIAFKQNVLPGQYPALFIEMNLPPEQMDINVHPAKLEARFLHSQSVFDTVKMLIEEKLLKKGVYATFTGGTGAYSAGGGYRGFTDHRAPAGYGAGLAAPEYQPILQTPYARPLIADELLTGKTSLDQAPANETESALPPLKNFKGIFFATFAMFEEGEFIWLLDQHAAHERIRYEALLDRNARAQHHTQNLLFPIVVKNRELKTSGIEALTTLGFLVENFGEDAVLFTGVPQVWGTFDLETRLQSLVQRAADLPKDVTTLDSFIFEKLASEACHSSVRSGDRLNEEKIESLIAQLEKCKNPYNCPHGRPILSRLSRDDLDQLFLRQV